MRGQKLFVRPIESSDAAAVAAFFAAHDVQRGVPAAGLLAKLVGDMVAVLSMDLTRDALRVEHLFVAPELRRKRIGRYMLDEASRLARKMDRDRIVIGDPFGADEFLRRAGFVRDGDLLVRSVG